MGMADDTFMTVPLRVPAAGQHPAVVTNWLIAVFATQDQTVAASWVSPASSVEIVQPWDKSAVS